ncbi:hypothetical protein LZ518_07030 [Sphingomonas sp. RB56-2]|uniref:Uncharacterized protein n=1 Tax=Sphingomonas brevis TaxID=2908206 RepID=A0ABT0S925_9SPHN|nr:hypothetical protein [Sphingomonas brevis]MCL6740882.1 hypothetical protein [Sphingomonas brevis]
MAYAARIETQNAEPIALTGVAANDTDKPDFSRLEWSVIRLARVDSLSTLREPGRWGRFVNWLMNRKGLPSLANERLEALRKMAVLSWHYGFTVPGEDVANFFSAGFSPDQYELMVRSIRAAVSGPKGMTA